MKTLSRLFKTILPIALVLTSTSCGSTTSSDQPQSDTTQSSDEIINIGVTDTVYSLNPLLMNGGEVTKYATGLMFLPLMELNAALEFEPMLADSITTEDNIHFTVHIDENATWSDGTPITSYDVEYAALRLCSPLIANTAMMYYVFEGVGDDGFVEEGATSISGITPTDDKTIVFTTKSPMALNTFLNSYARYLMPLPKHIIEHYGEDQLASAEWFNHPDVVSGPYMLTDYDTDHYVSYSANPNYWKGNVNIPTLNIRIMDAASLYAALQTGEIDVTQQTMSVIPPEDYSAIEALDNITVVYGDPITNQSMFINTKNIPDTRVRQAMLYAIDRDMILEGLLQNHGEIQDGFLSSASPYHDQGSTYIHYDPDKAKALLQQAGYDGSQTIDFYVNSGDSTFVNAANIIVANWQAVGINAKITTVDFATLMSVAGSDDVDVLAVQYTYSPVDPYTDIAWLLGGEGSWTNYGNASINEALALTQSPGIGEDQLTQAYTVVDTTVATDVPMISVYIISAMAAVNKRIENCTPSVYGFFNNVHEWKIDSNE